MTLTVRQRLRAAVWEMTGGICEWPACRLPATELAHITPRGMGHTGYRDRFANVMAACDIHARVTDDMTHPEWVAVHAGFPGTTGAMRVMLADMVAFDRRSAGFDVDGMQTEIDR